MTTYTVKKLSGGSFFGGSGRPSSGGGSNLTTTANDTTIVIVSFSSRSNTATDFHRCTAITGSGLTWSHVVNEDFTYTEPSGSFPVASWHCDVFVANVPTPITAQSWDSTMTGNDTFINDGWYSVYTIEGIDPTNKLDTHASNLVSSKNMGGSASAISLAGISTVSNNPFVLWVGLGHSASAASPITVPAGFGNTTSPATGDSHFAVNNSSSTTKVDIAGVFKEYASQQSGLTLASSSTHPYWWGVPIIFKSHVTEGLIAVEAKDSFSAVGYPGQFGKVGDLTATEAKDAFAAVGYPLLNGSLLGIGGRDTFSAFGRQPQTGTLAATEARDVFHSIGIGQGEDGTFIVTGAADIAVIQGNTPISGPFTPTEVPDKARFIGQGVSQVRRRRIFFVT